jgi:hypothetical protein
VSLFLLSPPARTISAGRSPMLASEDPLGEPETTEGKGKGDSTREKLLRVMAEDFRASMEERETIVRSNSLTPAWDLTWKSVLIIVPGTIGSMTISKEGQDRESWVFFSLVKSAQVQDVYLRCRFPSVCLISSYPARSE